MSQKLKSQGTGKLEVINEKGGQRRRKDLLGIFDHGKGHGKSKVIN